MLRGWLAWSAKKPWRSASVSRPWRAWISADIRSSRVTESGSFGRNWSSAARRAAWKWFV